jgi:magnesium-transporting ATPase (P-type)
LFTGLVVGHFNTIPLLMMVNKHGATTLTLGLVNIGNIILVFFANLFLFPFLYRTLGPDKGIPAGLTLGGVLFGCGWFAEPYLGLYLPVLLISFTIIVTTVPAGLTLSAGISKAVSPDAAGSVQGNSSFIQPICFCDNWDSRLCRCKTT